MMPEDARIYKNLIIAGTIKAATSSVFAYLSAHPQVCGSSVKETFFFTHQYTGVGDRDLKRYLKYFSPSRETSVLVEASPNYLAYNENIAQRIIALLPEASLLFILRDPVDRIYSHYNFAVAKLEIPESLTFEDYLDLCEQFASGKVTPEQAGVAEKHLRALEIGKYGKHLKNYCAATGAGQIKVVFYDDLKTEPERFMTDICRFIDVDPEFYRGYAFNKVNVTFSPRRRTLHFLALLLNRSLEVVLRQRPGLKNPLVKLYKMMNQNREGYPEMAGSTRARLESLYRESSEELREVLNGQKLPGWLE